MHRAEPPSGAERWIRGRIDEAVSGLHLLDLGELAESLPPPLDAAIDAVRIQEAIETLLRAIRDYRLVRAASVKAERAETKERVLLKICADLREVDDRLAQMCGTLPKPTATFHAQGELRGTLECVRTDLLADAILTLRTAARRGCEAEWRYAFEQRVKHEADGR